MTTCTVCQRLHGEDQPCPQRVALALLKIAGTQERLTNADKQWMRHHSVSVLKILEEELASMIFGNKYYESTILPQGGNKQ